MICQYECHHVGDEAPEHTESMSLINLRNHLANKRNLYAATFWNVLIRPRPEARGTAPPTSLATTGSILQCISHDKPSPLHEICQI